MDSATESPCSSADGCSFAGTFPAADNSAQQCTSSSPSNRAANYIASTAGASIGVISSVGVTIGRIRVASAGGSGGYCPKYQTCRYQGHDQNPWYPDLLCHLHHSLRLGSPVSKLFR
jgi:hypothetical protein